MIGSHNTWYGPENVSHKYPRPRIYGIGVNVSTGDIFPAEFPDKNPDADLRHVRLSFRQFESLEEYQTTKKAFYQDYDDETGQISIEPFGFSTSPDLGFIAKSSNKFILENMSTSPKVEPKHFCCGIRNSIKLAMENPDPYKSIFVNRKARRYKYLDKKWIRIDIE